MRARLASAVASAVEGVSSVSSNATTVEHQKYHIALAIMPSILRSVRDNEARVKL